MGYIGVPEWSRLQQTFDLEGNLPKTHHLCWFQLALNSAETRGGLGCTKLEEKTVLDGGVALMIAAPPAVRSVKETTTENNMMHC